MRMVEYNLIYFLHRKQEHQDDDITEKTLKCINCNATFKSSTQLKRHTANAHCSRPFKCPHCPHRSKNKANLERHVAFHTSNKDAFQCLHCDRKFAFKNSMKKHLEKGRCTVLKDLEKTQRKQGRIGPGLNSFKDFLEATIMHHLQQTPKSPPIASRPNATLISSHRTLSSILSQPQVLAPSSSNISVISRNNESAEMVTSMDTSPSPPSNNFIVSSDSIPAPSSFISSYNSISNCTSGSNSQSCTPMIGNDNDVPNDTVYQFDTTGNSINHSI